MNTTTTKTENLICSCGGSYTLIDRSEDSRTVWCAKCQQTFLLIKQPEYELTIRLSNFHLRRGNGPDQRRLDDLTLATRLYRDLLLDFWPSQEVLLEIGLKSVSEYCALRYAVRWGVTAYDLDRVMGDGQATTELAVGIPGQPYSGVEYSTMQEQYDLHTDDVRDGGWSVDDYDADEDDSW